MANPVINIHPYLTAEIAAEFQDELFTAGLVLDMMGVHQHLTTDAISAGKALRPFDQIRKQEITDSLTERFQGVIDRALDRAETDVPWSESADG